MVKSFEQCIKQKTILQTTIQKRTITALRSIAKKKYQSAKSLHDEEHHLAKVCLLYDVLREYLEAKALEKGYKIYNHECYVPFIKDILKKEYESRQFDKLRIIRNNINYHGKDIERNEAIKIINSTQQLIDLFNN